MIQRGTWLIFPLTLEGSYLQNIERPAQGPHDTFQYWIAGSKAYDVRTCAIDRDIRILELDLSSKHKEERVPMLLKVARRTYAGIIAREVRIEVDDGESVDDLVQKVTDAGLFPHVEWTALDFPLWLPEHAKYESKSE